MSPLSLSPSPTTSEQVQRKPCRRVVCRMPKRLLNASGMLLLLHLPSWSLACQRHGIDATDRLRGCDAAGWLSCACLEQLFTGLHTAQRATHTVILKSVVKYRYSITCLVHLLWHGSSYMAVRGRVRDVAPATHIFTRCLCADLTDLTHLHYTYTHSNAFAEDIPHY